MSRRPNIVDPHEKEFEKNVQDARAERDRQMAQSAGGVSVTTDPEPYILSFSRGPAGHEVPAEVQAWIEEEACAQMGHYRRIYQEVERLAPERDRWVEGFFERISGPRGFSVHAGTRKTIPQDQIPERPDRVWRLVW